MTTIWPSAVLAALGGSALASALAILALAGSRARGSAQRRFADLDRRLREVEAWMTVGTSERAPSPKAARRVDPSARTESTLIAVPSLADRGSEALASEALAELGRRFAPVWNLADAGESSVAIARAIGRPVGQVELMLALRRPDGRGRAVSSG